jgi:hypothetical protein
MPDELFNQANRDFEISPGFSKPLSSRLDQGFQRFTVVPGLRFTDAGPTTAPGALPEQTGPSPLINGPGGSGGQLGDSAPSIFNLIANLGSPDAPTAHPDSVPPIGPEERIRYSCVSGKCLQDPNGVYLGIDECLASGCGSGSGGGGGGGGGGNGCDCGCGLSHTAFKASITGAFGPILSGGRNYWAYSWVEIGGLRSSILNGMSINEYELSYNNDGGNIPPGPALLTRLKIPTGAVVDMMLDLTCVPWFSEPNPLQVTCV